MIKRNFVSILLLSAALFLPEVYAQKSGKIEKLMAFLVENDTDKFQKNREKLDEESKRGFPDEVALVDAIYGLWFEKKPEAAVKYLTSYDKAVKKSFLTICAKEKINVDQVRTRADNAVVAVLGSAADKVTLSKQALDAIQSTKYPMAAEQLAALSTIREEALVAEIMRQPTAPLCEAYFGEFPKGRFLHLAMYEYNAMLFKAVKEQPSADTFKRFFDNEQLNALYEQPNYRKYIEDARSLYDDYLYGLVLKAKDLKEIKNRLTEYNTTKYLSDADRKHAIRLEHKTDSVDYELLKEAVKSVNNLGLIKEYLATHHYKEYRDKANELRQTFEGQVIWTTPTYMRSYAKGLLMTSTELTKDRSVSATYSYSDKGKLGAVTTNIREKGQESILQTNFFFDVHGHCLLEVQTNGLTKKEIYRRSRQITAAGQITSDSLCYADGRLGLFRYDAQGNLQEEKEFLKDKLTKSVTYQYDAQGRKQKVTYTYALPDTPKPMHVLSQTETFEYDRYGYPKQITVERVLANNEKMKGVLAYLYDQYGNQIDSNAYYEYDHTGRWIRKMDSNDSSNIEYVQCSYR